MKWKRVIFFLIIPAIALTLYSVTSNADYLKMYGPTTQVIVDPGDAVAIAVSDSIRQANYIDSTQVKNGGIGNADLQVNSVDSTKVRDGSISNADLRAISVDSTKVRDGSIAPDDLRADAVDSTKVANGGISADDLRPVSVDSSKVRTGGISADNLRNVSVDSSKVRTGGISNANLRTDAVDSTKVRNASISGADLVSPLRLTGDLFFNQPHAFFGFSDSSYTRTMNQNIWYSVSNDGGNLFAVVDTLHITRIAGDTIQVNDPGDYHILAHLSFSGNNGETWRVNALHADTTKIGFSSLRYTSSQDTGSLTYQTYHTFTAGEKFFLGIKNISDNDDAVFKSGTIYIKKAH